LTKEVGKAAGERVYKRRSGLVQDLWVIQETPVGTEGGKPFDIC